MEYTIHDISELDAVAAGLLDAFPSQRVFAFYGEMGVGKTTFIKKICETLHVVDVSNSPSFGIINEYKTENGEPVFHFDFYRIRNAAEFLDLGCEEYLNCGHYCFIEWPEKIENFLPADKVAVHIFEQNLKRILRF